MNFLIGEELESYLRRRGRMTPVIGVEYVFLAAMDFLRDKYGGGGVFHYEELHSLWWGALPLQVQQSQQPYTPPDPWAVLTPEQQAVAKAKMLGKEHGVIAYALPGPPPGWQPLFTHEYQELVARHRTKALERRARHTTL